MCSSPVVHEGCCDVANARAAEKSLVAAAIQGDEAAFEMLALRHKRRVMAITWRMTGSFGEAEDLTQQAFLRAFVNLSSFEGRCSFSTWLISIAMNEARMWLRKARKNSREVAMSELCANENLDAPLDLMDWRPGPEADYSRTEQNRLLFSEIERLTPAIRVAVKLCDLQEQSCDEAAAALGTTVGAVKSRRVRARAILRERLEARFTSAKQHRADQAVRSRRSTEIRGSR